MPLEDYRDKRDFSKTPEPAGEAAAEGGRLYIIQKHAATRLHYDFRLEYEGVLLSWAVPKGPSLDPSERHLAVHVEDHPVEYGSFEGTIPEGEYGGGTVLLWDRGTWEPEADPAKGLAKGELKFTLHGEKLRGSWVLAKMKGRSEEEGKDEWLLIKRHDEYAVDGDGQGLLRERPESVASGRTLDEITADAEASVWHSDRPADAQEDVTPGEELRLDPGRLSGSREAELPRTVRPELALLVDEAPSGEGWLHEIKFDGYRAVAHKEGGAVRVYSRNGKDWTARYDPIVAEIAALPARSALLDGEVVVQLSDGTTDFQALQNDLGAGRTDRLYYYVFDLLHLDGYDLTAVPLEERKRVLRLLLARAAGARLRYTEHIVGDGPTFLEQACSYGLEGIVSKKAGSPYRPGSRGGDWRKAKCVQRQEFVVGGYTDWAGNRRGVGALLVGLYEDDGLRYAGKVGTGYTDAVRRELRERLEDAQVETPPFSEGAQRAPRKAHWVRPELVVEVAFTEWTRDGEVRHPSFKGVREDKRPGEVHAEEAAVADETAPDSGGREGQVAEPRRGDGAGDEVLGVRITNPERVYWPAEGVTKADLVEYYEDLAERMMPYVLHRPVSMVRCPEGVAGVGSEVHEDQGGPCFFHKHAGPDFPGPFERVEIEESKGPESYLTITEPGSLVALAQMGVLEIHIWGSRWPDIERPDMLVFDLDPAPEVGWAGAREGARLVRLVLRELGLESFVKTTGGKGLHVVVPVTPDRDWEGVKRFCQAVAVRVVQRAPSRYTSSLSKQRRAGKTFVDYLRNTRSATSVAPFSTRAKVHATVAVPIRWDELGGHVRPDSYTVKNLRRRLAQLRDDPWDGYFEVQGEQTITRAMERELGIG